MLLASCGKNNGTGNGEPTFEDKFCKEWHNVTLATGSSDIYLSFSKDKTFEIYQQIGEGAYRLYRGSYNLEENLLTGKYNDGEDWAAAYEVAMSDKFLTLTSKNEAAEENVFEIAAIPAEVKDRCVIMVKSAGE